ncbi:hypothetical protein [Bacillus cereus]|uniref:hypothetical protein n=1 Tax=Bacillus cereus TaxID=1396 RepID=UPI0018F399E6|nr:hypothetical protein [Bacillus cereus]MBJ7962183.1 hypothetical protein [Bacillus cereus]MBJ7999286.1 hypothetical protein [Bacillus cereus]
MNKKEGLKERKERTVLDNPPSDETALKMAEFFMRTSVPRILAEMKATEEAKKKVM